MRTHFTFLILIISTLGFSQGLKQEIMFDYSYNTMISNKGITTDDYSVFTYFDRKDWKHPFSITKVDNQGTILWKRSMDTLVLENQYPVSPSPYFTIINFFNDEEDNIYLAGYVTADCESMTNSSFILKLNTFGEKEWVKYYNYYEYELFTSFFALKSCAYTNMGLLATGGKDATAIYKLDGANGEIIDSLVAISSEVSYVIKNVYPVSDNFIVHSEFKIALIDENGTILNSIDFETRWFEMNYHNDKLVVLKGQEVKVYDSSLNLLEQLEIDEEEYPNLQNIQFLNDRIYLASKAGNEKVSILNYSYDLGDVQVQDIPIEEFTVQGNYVLHYSKERLILLNNHDTESFPSGNLRPTALRYLDFSLTDNTNNDLNRADISIEDIQFYDVERVDGSGYYFFNASAKVLIKNNGNVNVEKFNLVYHILALVICEELGNYSLIVDNISLAPGESFWLDLGQLANGGYNFNYDEANHGNLIEFCSLVRSPNNKIDLNEADNYYCGELFVETAGISENHLNPNKKVIKVVDLMGREVKEKPNRVLIYIYDDGTSEKKVFVE